MKSFLNKIINTNNVHLDYASTTPVAPEVTKSIKPFMVEYFFNPSASYTAGQQIKKMIKNIRTNIGKIFQVKENEIIFTQGGTESINLALIGLIKKVRKVEDFIPHVIISSIEHPAVNECIDYIKTLGVEVDYVPVLTKGIVDVQLFEKMINERTVLVSIIGASNETGVTQPIHKISSIVKKYKNSQGRTLNQYPFIHSDVSQLVLTKDSSITKLGVDMLTVDGSKIYAPKMSGILIKKQHVEIEPILFGGGQEFGLRSGTESVSSIVALDTALQLIQEKRERDGEHFSSLKKYFIESLSKTDISYEINGEGDIVPNILNICIPGLNSDFAIIQMDEYGVNCSAMTSCAGSKGILKSDVLMAMNKPSCAGSSIRFSFGRSTSTGDIKKAIKALLRVCKAQKLVQ